MCVFKQNTKSPLSRLPNKNYTDLTPPSVYKAICGGYIPYRWFVTVTEKHDHNCITMAMLLSKALTKFILTQKKTTDKTNLTTPKGATSLLPIKGICS